MMLAMLAVFWEQSAGVFLVTGWAVAQTYHGSKYRKVGNSTTPGRKTPEPIDTNFGVSNYVGDLTLTSKYRSNRSTWVVWAHA